MEKVRYWHQEKHKGLLALFVLFVLGLLLGCSHEPQDNHILYSPNQMNNHAYSIGVPQGAAAMTAVEQKFPQSRINYFQTLPDGYLAVKNGKLDAFAFDRHTLQYVVAQNPDLALMNDKVADERIVVGSALNRKELIGKINTFIRQYRADGTYQDMYNRWIMGKNTKMPDLPEPENPTMTLKIGTDGLNEPMSFYAGEQLTGFDIEFAKRLAIFLNAKTAFQTMEFSALVIAAQTGKIDLLVAALNETPERRKKLLFSETYVDSEITFLVRKDRLAPHDLTAITNLSQLAGKKIGVLTGSTYDKLLEQQIPGAFSEHFNSFSDQTEAVKSGKIAGFLVDEPIAKDIINQTSGVTFLKEMLSADGYAFAFAKSKPGLHKQVDAALREMRDNGALRKLSAKWFGRDDKVKVLPDLKPVDNNGVLRLATNSNLAPFAYMKNGKMVGYDIEIAMLIAAKIGRRLEITDMDFAAFIPSLTTGKSDMAAGGIIITPERTQSVLFTIPNYTGGVVVMVPASVRSIPPNTLARDTADPISDLSQLAGKKVGIITGSAYDSILKSQVPGAIPEYFNNFSDQTEAVTAGKIAGFLADEPMARDMINHKPGLTFLKKQLSSDGYAFAFAKNRPRLREQVNAALHEMKNDGKIKKIEAKWFGKDETAKVLPDLRLDGENGVLRFATNSGCAPFAYIKHGKIVGYDIEIVMTIARKLGRKLEIIDMEFAAIIPSLLTGKTDMAGCGITVTKERAQSVLFTDPNYTGGVVVMVAANDGVPQRISRESFLPNLVQSFKRTFLVEDRYKLVLQGLWVTILISAFSAIFGALLGFGVCIMRRAKTRWANFPARVFIRAIQGTPIVVLLMILYYIVFGGLDINAILVAIIGFSINFAAYVSEMMRTGIDAVDKGQQEAAYAIGFNRFQVFRKIIFPQAARHVLPVFKGEFISMLKMTSIVGYIAIQDLTKVSDIIRSRTYEAFFPLIATAVIYFLIAYAITHLLSRVEMSVDPKRRKRVVKGLVRP